MSWQVLTGDCVEVMAGMPEASVDAVVCDPPYSLPGGFMSKPWDCFDGREDAGFAYWLAGLIDGEGCFTIKAHTRGTHAPTFSLHMRADEEGTLRLIERTLRIGSITRSAREPHPMVRWTVQDKAGCQRLVDLLDKYPLRAKKRMDYAMWREAVCEWSSRPRGNRWHGAADNTRMASLRERLMSGRGYVEPAWSGHEFQDWCRVWAREALRVLKPGGHMLAAGGSRTYHRLTCAIEDAGFEVRDCITHMYGSGFPKSLDVSKAIDKAATPDAERWQGWGTALKPAAEFWVFARKPLSGTVAQNCLEHGTGALNIDATRIGTGERPVMVRTDTVVGANAMSGESTGATSNGETTTLGRWPANVCLTHSPDCKQSGTRRVRGATSVGRNRDGREISNEVYGARRKDTTDQGYADADGLETVSAWSCEPDCPVRLLDEQSGPRMHGAGFATTASPNGARNDFDPTSYGHGGTSGRVGDSGGASRFFPTFEHQDEPRFRYVAKASSAERNAGLDRFEEHQQPAAWGDMGPVEGNPRKVATGHVQRTRNVHPTVKPIDLMRWLVRLVTPPGGRLLDPFLGSGTTGCAAMLEGFDFVGIERDSEYVAIAEARIRWWSEHPDGMELVQRLQFENERKAQTEAGQESLF